MATLPPGLFSSFSGWGNMLLGIVVAVVVVGVIGMFFYFIIYKNKAYDTRVTIFSERAGRIVKIFYDRARFTKSKETGAPQIHLKRCKATIPSVYYSTLYNLYEQGLFLSRGGKPMLFLRETAENILYPVSEFDFTSDNNIKAKSIETDIALVQAAEIKYADSMFDKPKMWEKILPIMTIGVTGVFVVILVWYVSNDLKTIATSLQGIVQVCQAAANLG